MLSISLRELGWNEFFAENFAPYKAKGLIAARVVREHRKKFLVCTGDADIQAEMAGRIVHKAKSKADHPTVGDWVAIRMLDEGTGFIEAVLPRKSKFSRKSAGQNNDEQVVAVNVDTVFLVTDMGADFNLRRLERYLVLAWDSGALPVVILNKADLCHNVHEYISEVKCIAPEVAIHAISATEGTGIEQLHEYLGVGKTVAMLGSSGVGKSTLINSILGMERLEVQEVRKEDGRGRHTTTHRELILLPEGGAMIDNPGMRELQMLADVDPSRMMQAFEDVADIAAECKFRDCEHEHEPQCAVRQAVEDGRLNEDRVESFLKLRDELKILLLKREQNLSKKEVQKRQALRGRRPRRRKRDDI